jgi:redox-sensitive bicupin YhaK (pirin superfamily)
MLARRYTTPPPAPGFAGPGHTAVEVVGPSRFLLQDPFIALMDDRIDMPPGRAIGGAHPHAGIETVTLLLEGSVYDRDEGLLSAGDAMWMTAGRGIIHNEHVEARGPARVLQLWVTLPRAERQAAPALQKIDAAALPTLRRDGVEARLYSGSLETLRSPTRNHVPVTMIDLRLQAGARFEIDLPAYNGFIYVIEGVASVAGEPLHQGDVGWLDRQAGKLGLASESGARLILYAGQPQGVPIVARGPFVADSLDEIERLYREYPRFTRVSQLH